MDEALTGYTFHGGPVDRKVTRNDNMVFGHDPNFKSVTQPENSNLDAYYVLMLMREFVRDQQQDELPESLRSWCLKNMTEATDATHREEFGRIQSTIARIINQDVIRAEGLFYDGDQHPSHVDIERRSEDQGDYRPFTLDGNIPFPSKSAKSKKKGKNK